MTTGFFFQKCLCVSHICNRRALLSAALIVYSNSGYAESQRDKQECVNIRMVKMRPMYGVLRFSSSERHMSPNQWVKATMSETACPDSANVWRY